MKSFLLTVFIMNTAWAASPNLQAKADELYKAAQFSQALDVYLENKEDSVSHHYNVGTLYFRLERFGLAVAHFERANRLRPNDSDIQHNLRLARAELRKMLDVEKLDPASSWIELFTDQLPVNEMRGVLGFLVFLLIMTGLRRYFLTRRFKPILSQPLGLITLSLFIMMIILFGVERYTSQHPPAVLIENQTVRSGPGTSFVNLGRFHEGIKLRLLGKTSSGENKDQNQEIWHLVRYSGDAIGWVPASSLLLL